MAAGKTQTQVTWAAAATKSVAAASEEISDVIACQSTAYKMTLLFKADNAGTPASGDTVDLYLLESTGDPDAASESGDEYSTPAHGMFLRRLDTNTEDPARSTVTVPSAPTGFRIRAVNNSSARAVTVSCQAVEYTL